jgi:hypothetical protein
MVELLQRCCCRREWGVGGAAEDMYAAQCGVVVWLLRFEVKPGLERLGRRWRWRGEVVMEVVGGDLKAGLTGVGGRGGLGGGLLASLGYRSHGGHDDGHDDSDDGHDDGVLRLLL